MNKTWRWIVGILAVLALVGLLLVGRSSRQAYRIARGAVQERVALTQDRVDIAVEFATKAVDLALVKAGNLPSQQAQADLIKQDIQEIGNRLKAVAEARGELVNARMDQAIEQFNTTLNAVDDAAKKADNPEVKATLDRIYGALEAAKEALTQAILKTQG